MVNQIFKETLLEISKENEIEVHDVTSAEVAGVLALKFEKYAPVEEELKRLEKADFPKTSISQGVILQAKSWQVSKKGIIYSQTGRGKEDAIVELRETAALCILMLKELES